MNERVSFLSDHAFQIGLGAFEVLGVRLLLVRELHQLLHERLQFLIQLQTLRKRVREI